MKFKNNIKRGAILILALILASASSFAVYAEEDGYIQKITALTVGEAAMHLGAGRATKEDTIDTGAGIVLEKKIGDYVKKGEALCTVYTNKEDTASIVDTLRGAFVIAPDMPQSPTLIYKVIE